MFKNKPHLQGNQVEMLSVMDPISIYPMYFLKYSIPVRLMAWTHHLSVQCSTRRSGELTAEKLNESNIFIFKVMPNESFSDLQAYVKQKFFLHK